jgi:hypothetical protein
LLLRNRLQGLERTGEIICSAWGNLDRDDVPNGHESSLQVLLASVAG